MWLYPGYQERHLAQNCDFYPDLSLTSAQNRGFYPDFEMTSKGILGGPVSPDKNRPDKNPEKFLMPVRGTEGHEAFMAGTETVSQKGKS